MGVVRLRRTKPTIYTGSRLVGCASLYPPYILVVHLASHRLPVSVRNTRDDGGQLLPVLDVVFVLQIDQPIGVVDYLKNCVFTFPGLW